MSLIIQPVWKPAVYWPCFAFSIQNSKSSCHWPMNVLPMNVLLTIHHVNYCQVTSNSSCETSLEMASHPASRAHFPYAMYVKHSYTFHEDALIRFFVSKLLAWLISHVFSDCKLRSWRLGLPTYRVPTTGYHWATILFCTPKLGKYIYLFNYSFRL